MKKYLLLLSSLAVASSVYATEIEVKFAVGEWAPYTGEKLPDYGAASEVVTAAAKAGGLKPVYSFVPWKRAEINVADGEAFATFPYRKLPEREAKYFISDTIMKSPAGILRYVGNKKSAIDYSKIQDLQPFVVGVTAGSNATIDPLRAAKVRVEETATFDNTVMKLESLRVDFAIEDKIVAFDAVKRVFPQRAHEFKFLDNDFTPANTMHLLVSRKYRDSEALLKKFNAGLKKIAEDGTMKKIYAKYGLKP